MQLICGDPHLEPIIQDWLDRMWLNPDRELVLEVRVGEPNGHRDDSRPVFEQPTVLVYSGPPSGDVIIKWRGARADGVLRSGQSKAEVTLSTAAVERIDECLETFLLIVVVFLLRRAGWHHVHGGTAVDPRGRGWLLAGNTQSGKSTTVALLASLQWAVGTDDAAFMTRSGDRVAVIGRRAPIALRETGYALLGTRVGKYLQRRDKMACWPEELGAQWVSTIEPDVVLIPQVGNGVTSVTPLSRREVLDEFLRWASPLVLLEPDLAQEHLDLITRLTKQACGYRILLGRDLFERPDRLAELIP